MNKVNKLLYLLGAQLSRTPESRIPRAFLNDYEKQLAQLKSMASPYFVLRALRFDAGKHPQYYRDIECSYVASHVQRIQPKSILDIGSARHFVLGLLSYYPVTTLDVRERTPATKNETVITCDAKKIELPDDQFDVVVSISSIEHFGLGRYGDEFDLDADHKAIREMIRVTRPGGHIIFTTTITGGRPSIAFNAHRIYDITLLHNMCMGMDLVDEKFYSRRLERFCSSEELVISTGSWDVYLGCWTKL